MEQETLIDYAAKFKAVIKHFGLKNSDIAEIGGVTDQAIRNILLGITKNPSATLIGSVAKKLNISLDWFMKDEGEMLESFKEPAPVKAKGMASEIWALKLLVSSSGTTIHLFPYSLIETK